MAFGIMDLMRLQSRALPSFYYVGVAREFQDMRAKHLSNQVESSVKQELFDNIETGRYPIEGYIPPPASTPPGVQASASSDSTGKPVFKEDLHYVAMRADNTLPIKVSILNQFQREVDKLQDEMAGARLKEITSAHNGKHNPGGEAFQDTEVSQSSGEKRGADRVATDPVAQEGLPSKETLHITREDNDPVDLATLKKQTSTTLVEGAESCYQNVFTDGGDWYLHGLDEGIVSDKVRVATVKGKYRCGQPAVGLLADGGQTHKLAMESDTHLVCIQVSGSLPKTLSSAPMPLKTVLEFLESCGKVRSTIVGHTVEPKNGGDGYNVTVSDTVAMQVKTESSGKRMTIENVAGLFDIDRLADNRYLHVVDTWQYQVNKNKFVPGYPTIWFKQPVAITKGQLSKLTKPKE